MLIDSLKKQLLDASLIIKNGGLVAFPTETVYGLGADATNPIAVAKIFEAKSRPKFDPLIVHIAEIEAINLYIKSVPAKAQKLIDKFWPGPLTIILPKKNCIPDIVTSGLDGVGIRFPDNEIAQQLIKLSGKPIAAPSANKFGCISPTRSEHVIEQLGNRIDMTIDGGPCTVGVESTIVSFMQEIPVMLRPGGLPLELIVKEIGEIMIPETSDYQNASPGRNLRHYAPLTPLDFGIRTNNYPTAAKVGLLTLTPSLNDKDFYYVEILSEKGNLQEAACNLFAALRRLDSAGLDRIIAEPVPDEGIGRAINDRLFRAACSRKS